MPLGFLAGFLISLCGWQINLIAIHKGLERSRRSAFSTGMGAACADLLFLYVFFKGSGPILRHPDWWVVLKGIGIVTVLAVGLKLLFKKPKSMGEIRPKKRAIKRYFVLGFVMVITNPAVFIFYLGLMSFIATHFDQAKEPVFAWKFMGGFLAGAAVWFAVLSMILLKKIKYWNDSYLVTASRLSGAVLLAAGLFLAIEKF